ncbi:hypothetical protein Q5P01_005503 [Channa striata]|uniref:Claudin n=1 Tax=Channa striata TaxID=64152 RepID=A0AA88NCR2_CHASR|nr:hypothetical protein Q5P01_005503 [Channa striata]
MRYRTTVMYMEIGCFVACLCGWMLVCSTLPTPFWSYSENSGVVITTADFYSNLWMDCLADNTGASACKNYPSMMALSVFLHTCRALAVCAVITGFFGGVLTLIGMKCTKIGGSEIANATVTFAAGITYLLSGLCGMITYSLWANKNITEFMDPLVMNQKYELGAAIFIGWGGSVALILGGAVLTYFSGKEVLSSSSRKRPQRPTSHVSGKTRRTYMLPASSSRMILVPPLLYEGRQSRTTRATTKTGQSDGRDNFV